MELMDDSLTHFLESSTQPIAYHIQVNICHDITLALSFLHSNGIIHRDLSSNNVLLRGDVLAKVADFGMVRLDDINPQATHLTNTMCPGTDVYMPPEAVQDRPVYTEKIDCFSFGVITVQTLTREFPKPRDRHKIVDDPRFPRGALKLSVPEIERRQHHISQVDPNHPLLPIALDCLKDADGERPSAKLLCERVAALKEAAKYTNISERVRDSSGKDGEYEQLVDQRDAIISKNKQQLRQCREELTQQIQQIQQQNQQQSQQMQQLEREKNDIIQQLERERDQAIQEKERQLGRVNQQLEESEQLIADFCKRNIELEEQLSMLRKQAKDQDSGSKATAVDRTIIKLRWREEKKAPCKMARYCDTIVDKNVVYCQYDFNCKLYAYHIPSSNWSPIPDCPTKNGFSITVIDGLLTAVGGYGEDYIRTNKLVSLTGEGSRSSRRWTEKFPPMLTKRHSVAVLCIGTALIVAGGYDNRNQNLKTVEVLNTETEQWHTAPDLLQPLAESSITLCGDLVYLLGGISKVKKSVYSCSLSSLLFSDTFKSPEQRTQSSNNSPWNRVADLPVKHFAAVTLYGQLLAIGGMDSEGKPSTAVHMYQPITDSWEVVSHMITPRYRCLAAVLSDYQLMVVGGYSTDGICDSVEFGRVNKLIMSF